MLEPSSLPFELNCHFGRSCRHGRGHPAPERHQNILKLKLRKAAKEGVIYSRRIETSHAVDVRWPAEVSIHSQGGLGLVQS